MPLQRPGSSKALPSTTLKRPGSCWDNTVTAPKIRAEAAVRAVQLPFIAFLMEKNMVITAFLFCISFIKTGIPL